MASGKQTPAPMASSGKDLKDENTHKLDHTVNDAEKGAAKKTSATKTPKKIQEGDTSQKKREY